MSTQKQIVTAVKATAANIQSIEDGFTIAKQGKEMAAIDHWTATSVKHTMTTEQIQSAVNEVFGEAPANGTPECKHKSDAKKWMFPPVATNISAIKKKADKMVAVVKSEDARHPNTRITMTPKTAIGKVATYIRKHEKLPTAGECEGLAQQTITNTLTRASKSSGEKLADKLKYKETMTPEKFRENQAALLKSLKDLSKDAHLYFTGSDSLTSALDDMLAREPKTPDVEVEAEAVATGKIDIGTLLGNMSDEKAAAIVALINS